MNREFLKSIDQKLIVFLTFKTVKGNVLKRRCIPYNIGPHKRFKDKSQRYHFLLLKGPEKSHPVFLLPQQILKIEKTGEHFDPNSYKLWRPMWFVNNLWNVT